MMSADRGRPEVAGGGSNLRFLTLENPPLRFRCRIREPREALSANASCAFQPVLSTVPRQNRGARYGTKAADHVHLQILRRGRRADLIRRGRIGHL